MTPFDGSIRYCGKLVYVHPMLGPRLCSVRVHRKKRWMTEAYHNRIQKKWDKRYGKQMRDDALVTRDAVFLSAEAYQRLKDSLCTHSQQ